MSVSIAEYIEDQKNRFTQLELSGFPLESAARTTHALMANRIFVDGKNADDGDIGQYNDTNPLYVNPSKNSLPSFQTKGKTGKSKFANGDSHKTGYFDSYKDFRKAVGRGTSKVDLVLSGGFQSGFANGLFNKSDTEWVSMVSGKNADILEGQEERFGRIFGLTDQERATFKEVIVFEANKIFRK